MGPTRAIMNGLTKLTRFSGRASPSEFWWFVGPIVVVAAVILVWDDTNPRIVGGFQQDRSIWVLVVVVMAACAAAGARRMHDQGVRGRMFWVPLLVSGLLFISIQTRFIDFNFAETTGLSQVAVSWRGIQSTELLMASVLAVPLIWIALLFAALLPAQSGPNRYGPNPLEVTS